MEKVKLQEFTYQGVTSNVNFIETTHPNIHSGCDVYSFIGDSNKDLGVIRIKKGGFTPLQKVLKGDKTIEGYISGSGKLIVGKINGDQKIYTVNGDSKGFSIEIKIGETMQWHADNDSELLVFEICYPPYEDGRFDNM